MTTMKNLLEDRLDQLLKLEREVREAIKDLDGDGPDIDENQLEEMTDIILSGYRHEYKEMDFQDLLGSEFIRLEAAITITEM